MFLILFLIVSSTNCIVEEEYKAVPKKSNSEKQSQKNVFERPPVTPGPNDEQHVVLGPQGCPPHSEVATPDIAGSYPGLPNPYNIPPPSNPILHDDFPQYDIPYERKQSSDKNPEDIPLGPQGCPPHSAAATPDIAGSYPDPPNPRRIPPPNVIIPHDDYPQYDPEFWRKQNPKQKKQNSGFDRLFGVKKTADKKGIHHIITLLTIIFTEVFSNLIMINVIDNINTNFVNAVNIVRIDHIFIYKLYS